MEEFVSIDKSREVFDADLAGYGILALFITITNNSFHDYTIERGAIATYLDAQLLLPLSAKEAAEQSTAIEFERRVKAQDIAYGVLAFNPAGLVVIGSHMLYCLGNSECDFKQERERRKHAIEYDRKNIPLHFEKLELRYAPLPSGEKAEGFVYFKLSDKAENLLERMTLQVIARNQHSGSQAEYNFSFGQPR